jgi:hypothetical protein
MDTLSRDGNGCIEVNGLRLKQGKLDINKADRHILYMYGKKNKKKNKKH